MSTTSACAKHKEGAPACRKNEGHGRHKAQPENLKSKECLVHRLRAHTSGIRKAFLPKKKHK